MQQVQERIRSKVDLQRKQEKLSSKYHAPRPRVTERERELSPGYLEGALEEVCATHTRYLTSYIPVCACLIIIKFGTEFGAATWCSGG